MKTLITAILLLISQITTAQSDNLVPPVDQSPMDVSYFPANYPILKIQNKATAQPVMRVIYSRPHKGGRLIFGGLVEFGDVWRLGANEATEIDLYRNVKVGGKTIKKGRYTMYAIPAPDKWTIILNNETDTWGAFKYNSSKDVVRTTVPVIKNPGVTEYMSIYFTPTNSGAAMNVVWDDVKVSLPIQF